VRTASRVSFEGYDDLAHEPFDPFADRYRPCGRGITHKGNPQSTVKRERATPSRGASSKSVGMVQQILSRQSAPPSVCALIIFAIAPDTGKFRSGPDAKARRAGSTSFPTV